MAVTQKMPARQNNKFARSADLKKKISDEFEIFFLEQMCTSKENIFSHSAEIEMKKNLRNALMEMADHMDEGSRSALMVRSNLLENAYRYCTDRMAGFPKVPLKKSLWGWVKSLNQPHEIF